MNKENENNQMNPEHNDKFQHNLHQQHSRTDYDFASRINIPAQFTHLPNSFTNAHNPASDSFMAAMTAYYTAKAQQQVHAMPNGSNSCVHVTSAGNAQVPNAASFNTTPLNNVTSYQLRIANIEIPVPTFDPLKSTPQIFIQKVERYFMAQNYPKDQFLYLLPTVLSPELEVWWDRVQNSIFTWEQFTVAFIAMNEQINDDDDRIRFLENRTQSVDEPIHSFIYDMEMLSMSIFPSEPKCRTIRRIKNALHPSLQMALGAGECFSVEHLFKCCKDARNFIKSHDSFKNTTTIVPPLYKKQEDPDSFENDGNHIDLNSTAQCDANLHNRNSRQKTRHKRKFMTEHSEDLTNAYYDNEYDANQSSSHVNYENSNLSPNSSSEQFDQYLTNNNYDNDYDGNQNSTNVNYDNSHSFQNDSSKYDEPEYDNLEEPYYDSCTNASILNFEPDYQNKYLIQCFKCLGWGHKQAQCPSEDAIASYANYESNDWNNDIPLSDEESYE